MIFYYVYKCNHSFNSEDWYPINSEAHIDGVVYSVSVFFARICIISGNRGDCFSINTHYMQIAKHFYQKKNKIINELNLILRRLAMVVVDVCVSVGGAGDKIKCLLF